jgi:hypothetical protein
MLSTSSKIPAITAREASGNKQLGQEVDDGVRSANYALHFFSPALLPFHGIFLWPYACISVANKCISSSHGKSNHVCVKKLTWRRLEVAFANVVQAGFSANENVSHCLLSDMSITLCDMCT